MPKKEPPKGFSEAQRIWDEIAAMPDEDVQKRLAEHGIDSIDIELSLRRLRTALDARQRKFH